MPKYVIHPGTGNSPKQRRVYSRSDKGTLRRLPRPMEQMMLLKYDIDQSEKERKRMRQISMNRKFFIFLAVAAIAIIIALTVNFPSF